MSRRPDWAVEGRDWPNRAASRFVEAGGLRWHVQVMGAGPVLLLLHGTGAASHSWRDCAPLLARSYTIVAPDLPGHGFSSPPRSGREYALPSVARGVASLLEALQLTPHAIIGHSAGAAIAARMGLDGAAAPGGIVGLNAALLPFPGPFGVWAPYLARGLFYNPFAVALFSARAAQRGAVAELIRGTGSDLNAEGLELYERLFRTSGHVEAAIGLMAHWDLAELKTHLPELDAAVTLLVAEKDRAVPPRSIEALKGVIPNLRIRSIPGLGHLAHEEAPDAVCAMVLEALGPERLARSG